MRVRSVATLVVALVVGFAGFGILAADAANPAGFAAVVNPLDQMPADGFLEGTSCASASSCVAVGDDVGLQPLVLAGDPSSWGLAQTREVTLGGALDKFGDGSFLSSVACPSSTACVAVGGDGNDEPLVLAGNPATWSAAQAREIAFGGAFSELFSVTCTSVTACVAVGTDGNLEPFVLAGNPATWGVAQAREIKLGTAFGSAGDLWSVTCSSSSSCVAVGDDFRGMPLVLAGNPATWTAAQAHEIVLGSSFGSGGSLESVACTSASSCLVVGIDKHNQPLVLSGNPSSWGAAQAHEVTLGSGFGSKGFLWSVTCTSSSSCVAVGRDGKDQPLMVAGDPSTTWSAAQAREVSLGAGFGSGGALYSVSCTSSSTCIATGADAASMPLVLAGDPSTWGAAQAQELTLRGKPFGVAGVPSTLTCVSGTSCLALGNYGFLDPHAYFIHGSPATWNAASPTLMTGVSQGSQFAGETCPSSTYCVAVGRDGHTGEPLALVGDPSTWATAHGKVIALGSTFHSGGRLESVACSSTTSCVAVGYDNSLEPFVLRGNPATWTSANAVRIKLTAKLHSHGALISVTCSSATACVAVGFDGFLQEPLVLVGNPLSWKSSSAKQVTLNAATGSEGGIGKVACTSSTSCVAVGSAGKGTAFKPLVLVGNPAHWTATQAFILKVAPSSASAVAGFGGPGKGTGQLASVSCDKAGYCVAIGGDKNFAPLYIAGNPKKWKGHLLVRPAKSGASFATAELSTSSCTSTTCFAGGSANGGDFLASFTSGLSTALRKPALRTSAAPAAPRLMRRAELRLDPFAYAPRGRGVEAGDLLADRSAVLLPDVAFELFEHRAHSPHHLNRP